MAIGNDVATPIPQTPICRHCGEPSSAVKGGTLPPDYPPSFCKWAMDGEWLWCATLEVGVRKFRFATDLDD